jgi:S-adenosylmethionine decarboxylase
MLDLYQCQADLNDTKKIHEAMRQAAVVSKTTILNSYVHQFCPQGVSCMVVISESHLSVHTWPEFQHAQVDVFTCGTNALPSIAVDYLHTFFKPQRSSIYQKDRGDLEVIKSYIEL